MLYPPIEPHSHGMLDVGDGHQVYWEECGNPQGQAVVFLHGGPGAGCTAMSRRFFDPHKYRIILFDQRGCGRSVPYACTNGNFVDDLVSDMEQLRESLGVQRWVLFGGSWGSTLALAYARHHGHRVLAMVLRGVFMGSSSEQAWLYSEQGAGQMFPEAWEQFIRGKPSADHEACLQDFAKDLQCPDPQLQMQAALTWCQWEEALCSVDPPSVMPMSPKQSLAMAKIATHMFTKDPGLQDDLGWRAGESLSYLKNIPGFIVQGQWDVVTPAITAWRLHKAWPDSHWRMVQGAGHSTSDTALQQALVETMDSLV